MTVNKTSFPFSPDDNRTPERDVPRFYTDNQDDTGFLKDRLTQGQLHILFKKSPELFVFIEQDKKPLLRYEYDVFTRYPQVYKGVPKLRESLITPEHGQVFEFVFDDDSRRIATQQRQKLGITLPELIRNAIWLYLEILTDRPEILEDRLG